MRRIVYVISNKYGIEIESTLSYVRAVKSLDEGCSFKTLIKDYPHKLTKEERSTVAKRESTFHFKKRSAQQNSPS